MAAGRTIQTSIQISIAGTGSAVPAAAVPTSVLEERLALPAGSLAAATGVSRRHVCGSESQIDLAVEAARGALRDAGMDARAIDLVICASAVPYQPIPSTAPLVMRELGLPDGSAAAFDVNSTCLGFLTAFETAGRLVGAGRHRAAMVVCAEVASRALPWAEAPQVAALFGDGAAAAVLVPSPPERGGVRAILMRTFPSGYEACGIGAGGTRFDFREDSEAFARHALFSMDGRELFRLTSRHFPAFVGDLLEQAGWRRQDVDIVVPHQASPAALDHLARQVGFARETLVDITADYGNQIAASMPFAFDLARRAGRMPPGTRALFLGTSAGISFGGMALEC